MNLDPVQTTLCCSTFEAYSRSEVNFTKCSSVTNFVLELYLMYILPYDKCAILFCYRIYVTCITQIASLHVILHAT
jgi:hypothetical protein